MAEPPEQLWVSCSDTAPSGLSHCPHTPRCCGTVRYDRHCIENLGVLEARYLHAPMYFDQGQREARKELIA